MNGDSTACSVALSGLVAGGGEVGIAMSLSPTAIATTFAALALSPEPNFCRGNDTSFRSVCTCVCAGVDVWMCRTYTLQS